MPKNRLIDQYMEPLLEGRRQVCQDLVQEVLNQSESVEDIYHELLWPAMEQVEKMYRNDQINIAAEHMATRINRMLADQVQKELPRSESNGKRILITCAEGQREELGAEMCADLFESQGWDVYFVGGGVPNDEILSLAGQLRPEILMVYGMTPQGVPGVRALIDMIRMVGVNPTMNVLVTGGVFNRAEELWKEIHADLYAPSIQEALQVAFEAPPRVPEVRVPGAPKKRRRRRRRPILLTQAERSRN